LAKTLAVKFANSPLNRHYSRPLFKIKLNLQEDTPNTVKMVSEDKIDMSLDDIIASNKKSSRGGGRGRGRGRGASRGGRGSSGAAGGRRDSAGPVKRGRGGSRSAPYNRPKGIPDKWEHDMYDGAGAGARGRRSDSGISGRVGVSTGAHLQISNLDFGVTETDVKELFTEFGKLKKATINYDSSGRSHGTADVVFERRDDAAKAFKTYNGVPLDGRPMKIEQVTPQVSTNFGRRDTSNNYGGGRMNTRQGGRGARGGDGGNRRGSTRGGSTRGGGRGSSRGGRGARGGARGGKGRGPPPSKEDLDKELDSYIEAAN